MKEARWLVLAATVALASCGGGGDAEDVEVRPQGRPPLAANAVSQAPALVVSFAETLAWAEATYPQFFPSGGRDGTLAPYSYRHYAATGNYIGTDGDNRLFLHGNVTGGNLSHVGHTLDFACQIKSWLCDTWRPLSTVQAQYLATTLGAGYSALQFATSPATNPPYYFFVTRSTSASPRESADATAINTVTATLPLVGGPAVPAEYAECRRTSTYGGLGTYLDDQGNPADVCHTASWRVQFLGDAVYYSAITTGGRVARRYEITSIETTDIGGRNIVDHLRTMYPGTTPFAYVKANPATYPSGSLEGTLKARLVNDLIYLLNPNYSLPTSAAAIQPVNAVGQQTPASRIEDVLPAASSGKYITVNGRRVWRSDSSSTWATAFVEINGKVYAGQYAPASTVSERFTTFHNEVARDAVVNAGLDW